MAIIGVRDLLRDHKDILARIEDDNEPFLITRHGKPVAALVPVDPSQAERYVLASSPDFIQLRNEVAAEPQPVTPLEDVAAELGIEPEPPAPDERELLPTFIYSMFGEDVADQLEKRASNGFADLSDSVMKTAEESGLIREPSDADRVRELNHKLFNFAFNKAVADSLVVNIEDLAMGAEASSDKQAFGKTLANDALEKTWTYVIAANENFFVLGEEAGVVQSLGAYEMLLRSKIDDNRIVPFSQRDKRAHGGLFWKGKLPDVVD